VAHFSVKKPAQLWVKINIHDHLDYSELVFYPKLCAFNIGWHQKPKRTMKSHIAPLGYMVAPRQWADTGHAEWYQDFPTFVSVGSGDV
jgi:hypothetical protein